MVGHYLQCPPDEKVQSVTGQAWLTDILYTSYITSACCFIKHASCALVCFSSHSCYRTAVFFIYYYYWYLLLRSWTGFVWAVLSHPGSQSVSHDPHLMTLRWKFGCRWTSGSAELNDASTARPTWPPLVICDLVYREVIPVPKTAACESSRMSVSSSKSEAARSQIKTWMLFRVGRFCSKQSSGVTFKNGSKNQRKEGTFLFIFLFFLD